MFVEYDEHNFLVALLRSYLRTVYKGFNDVFKIWHDLSEQVEIPIPSRTAQSINATFFVSESQLFSTTKMFDYDVGGRKAFFLEGPEHKTFWSSRD